MKVVVAEKGLLFRQMLRTLRDAKHAVEAELEPPAGSHSVNAQAVASLKDSAAELAQQAMSLILMMEDEGADRAMIEEAWGLADFFRTTVDHLAFLAAAGRGWR